jgi:hypothetical protein
MERSVILRKDSLTTKTMRICTNGMGKMGDLDAGLKPPSATIVIMRLTVQQ